ncbi:MAG: dicarboxylate/amino acid:cation symporter [Proteobacteria bacterium]|nr:dicarboxylate/amino acid:cation symporter [Pseudomonadota bacterium]
MNPKHRKFILLGLILALVVGWGTGWVRGAKMHAGIETHAALSDARQEHRAATYALSDMAAELEVLSASVTNARSVGISSKELRTSKNALSSAQKEHAELKVRVLALKRIESRASAEFSDNSTWYTLHRLIRFVGKLFLNLLNLLVIPLVVSSLLVGIVSLGDIRHVGRTGIRTLAYYFITTSIAVTIGIVLVQIVQPGVGMETAAEVAAKVHGKEDAGIVDTILQVFINEGSPERGAVPKNIFAAMASMNVLGVIVFTLFFGAALTVVGEKAKPVIAFFEGANEAILRMIHWVMYLLPFGVYGLIVDRLAVTGGGNAVWVELTRLGYYAATVIGGLAIHAVVVLPIILVLFAKRRPIAYLTGMAQALFTAFSTASSSATLPTTMECAEENNKVSSRSTSFVLPIGATINMDGTALYEAVAVIFIAQAYGIPMGATMLLVVFLTATLAAVGAAGIPEAGLVTMVIVLNATGLPLEGIAMLLSIDWFLDRCRTTVNVWGDSIGAAIIDRYELSDTAS